MGKDSIIKTNECAAGKKASFGSYVCSDFLETIAVREFLSHYNRTSQPEPSTEGGWVRRARLQSR